VSGLPEGLYEVRVKNLGFSTSTFCPLTASLTEQLSVALSLYTVGAAGGLAAVLPLLVILIKRKR
jgi:hypothetical protein